MNKIEKKFIVINVKDLRYLTEEHNQKLSEIIKAIQYGREKDGKKLNGYWVCNQDEPYAEQVKNIILAEQTDGCEKCDTFGGKKTFANQVCMPLNGKVQCIDYCIHQIVAALNAGGVRTTASCCGHGRIQGRIDLEDNRILWIEKPIIKS